jgi:hypothetical protein
MILLSAELNVGDQWVVIGFIPYEGIVMLAGFNSANQAAIALRQAALCGPEMTGRQGGIGLQRQAERLRRSDPDAVRLASGYQRSP